MSNVIKVAVVGAGGTGGYYGGALSRQGHDVTMIARGPHLDSIKSKGLRVNSVLLGDFHLDITATDNMDSIGTVDLIIFAVKSYGTFDAIKAMHNLIGPKTLIISTQNGIDSEHLLSQAFGVKHVLGCTATVSSMIEEPGIISQKGGPGSLEIGEMNGGNSGRVNEIVSICSEAGLNVESHKNIVLAIWKKFIFICALSGMTALTRKPIGEIFSQTTTTDMYHQVLAEVVAVGKAEGVDIPDDTANSTLRSTKAREPFIIGSMGHDLLAGRPIEIGLLNGRVNELGRKHNIPTPSNAAIEAALRPHEHGSLS